MANRCITINEMVRDLANKLDGESEVSVANLVGLWQERYHKDMETYPTAGELNKFKITLRDTQKKLEESNESFRTSPVSSTAEQAKVDLDFDSITRRDRVTLIGRLFSDQIDQVLLEMNPALNNRIVEASQKGDTKAMRELQNDLMSLNRYSIIEKLTPAGLFSRVKSIFTDYISDTEEGNIQTELNKINGDRDYDDYSSEEKLEGAKKRAAYKRMQFQKVNDNFRALSEEAASILLATEGIRVDPNYLAPKEANLTEDSSEGENEREDQSDDSSHDEKFKDGWMTNYKHVSSHESLSQAVRKVIRTVPKLGYDGFIEQDDLGFERYLDPNYVHAVLIDKLKDMIDSSDMLPLLSSLQVTKPWVEQVYELIESDEILFSQFYQDFRKDFMPYWIQKKKIMPDGSFKMQTISINKPEGISYLLDEWRDNYESGSLLTKNSVYKNNGEISKENAIIGLSIVEDLNNKFSNASTEEGLKLLENETVFESIVTALDMLGISVNPAVLRTSLTTIEEREVGILTDPIKLMLPYINVIFSGIVKGDIKSETREDGSEKRGDLINTFGSAYRGIAEMLASVTEDAIESSVRENEKSFYSHLTPAYMGKLMKKLKNVIPNKAPKDPKYKSYFEEFIDTEFKQYDWFYKDGKWRNDWLEFLVTSEEARKNLNHKTVLNSDKVEYTNWDNLDTQLALLTEYWGDPESSKSKTAWAWYQVPILSDAPSAEFIKFRKYTMNSKTLNEDGDYVQYDDILLDKFTNIVSQEFDRIKLVEFRDAEYQQGNSDISPITNYDIARKKDGSIKSIGGAEFKFIPALNNVRYENGELFLDRLKRLSNEGTGDELKDFIRGALREVMDNGFEEAYRDWNRLGLLTELPNGKYKHLAFDGQSKANAAAAQALNRAKTIIGSLWTTDMSLLLRDYNNNSPIDNRVASNIVSQITSLLQEKVVKGDITQVEFKAISSKLTVTNKAKEALREYYWNSKFAASQIIQLSTTDLAFYKDAEDFQKRYKEVHAPALKMNTQARYNGTRIGKDFEKTIYIQDEEIVSSSMDDISTILSERVKKGEMSVVDKNDILKKFGEVNVADAQAYRSLSSMKAVLGMSGKWNEAMEVAFNNFKNNTWSKDDFDIIWQTIKPYLYTQVNTDSGIAGHSGIKTPVQHKNSEFLLMAMHSLVAGNLGKSGKLVAINKLMEEHDIDVVQFESAVKVGKQGIINLSGVNSEKEVMDVLLNATGISSNQENPNVVHKVSYEDYGIQTATPEHGIDAVQLVGTQIRKLITADISNGTIIEVNGKKFTKSEWLSLYNAVNTENIIQSFQNISDIFKDPKEIEKVLLEEIRNNGRYGIDMQRACTLNEKGEFNIPLFDPVQSIKVQNLLNSIIKSRITKQKIRGGALIQVSNYGLTDDLHIVFEGEGETKRIKYLECYMPWYTRELLLPFMNTEDHTLDISKIPDDLRKLVGYRVPTEDKYSMVPLYIKGFSPRQNGTAIMLPSEITTLSGSDFDVDKLYIMLPEFKITKKYDRDKFIKELIENQLKGRSLSKEEFDNLASSIREAINNPQDENQEEIKNTYLASRESYRVPTEDKIEKIKYDHNKSPQDNTLEQRNNLLIDMMWGVLTNADTASKILNPGGFDYQKRAARINIILENAYEADLKRELNTADVGSKLISMGLEELSKLANRYKKPIDPLSPLTYVYFHDQNMTGAKMIGVYANHNASHALMQHTELGLHVENGSFLLNNKRLTSLHSTLNTEKEYISRNNAGYLAASVDNVKDPVLAALNQNLFTGDASCMLSRLGYTPIEVGLLMKQPIVVDMTNRYFRESREGKGKNSIMEDVLLDYKHKASLSGETSYDSYKSNKFLLNELAEQILISKEAVNITDKSQTSDYRKVDYYKKQVAIGYLFQRVMKSADSLGQLVSATRADTNRGAAGPTIADTKIKMQKLKDFLDAPVTNTKFPLVNADVLNDKIEVMDDLDDLRFRLLNSKLPFLQAFYTLGIQQTEVMLGKYFPHFSNSFDTVIDTLRKKTRLGRLDIKTMNSVYNDLFAYIMSNKEFFGDEDVVTSSDKRGDFINNFPIYFKDVLTRNSEIAELEFIKRLKIKKADDNNPIDTLAFKNVGQLSPDLKERYMRDWQSLLYMKNPEAQQLALNLFRYSYYRNGFAFGPSTFIHLAPTAVRQAIPEYISGLNDILKSEDDYSQFVDQYIHNHLDNKRLVSEIPESASTKFHDEKGFKDEVSIIIDNDANYGDKSIIKEKTNTEDGVIYTFFDYISRREKGKYAYYILDQTNVLDLNEAKYVRIEPLGFKNSFIEYEYGKDVSEMKSVLTKNDRDYTPNANLDAMAYNTPTIISDENAIERYAEIYNTEAMMEAYGMVYDSPIESQSDNSMVDMQPNTEYKDANDDVICGSTL